jgi:glycosyltransferase involved in cell wall biosynthesis
MLDVLMRYGIQTPAEVVPTGIDLAQFGQGCGARFRERWGIPPTRPLLVHVGRLAFEKNCDFLLRMLAHVRAAIPNVLLVIAGGGPALKRLQRLARRLDLDQQVLFTGYLARDGSLEDCYCAGDAFVFSSRTETQGLVLLESMALGTPVVAIAEMGTREVLRDSEGCLIAEHDEAQFAAQCVRLLREPVLRAELAASARAYAQRWSAPVLAKRMVDFYAAALLSVERRLHDPIGGHSHPGGSRASLSTIAGEGQVEEPSSVRMSPVSTEDEHPSVQGVRRRVF